MFEKTESNYKFILILWAISIGIEIFLQRIEHSHELQQMILANVSLLPQFQMLAYAAYLGVYLYVNTRDNIEQPKLKRTLNNVIKLLAKSSTTVSIVFIDLVMITVTIFSFFTAAIGAEINIPYNWHILFLHVIAPVLALWMNYNLRNQKLELRKHQKLDL